MTAFNDTFGIIGFSSENVGIDRRIYTGLTSTNPQLNVSYNGGRVDVYLNGVKLMGNHSGQNNYDYTYQGTGSGSAITLSTGVALVATDTIECVGYVSNSSNTVTSYNPTPANTDGGFNVFASISHSASDLVNVFLNGVLLDDSDYTLDSANNKVTIGGTTLTASDVVVIQVIGALDNSNFVPVGGGTFSGNVSFGDNNITNVGDIAVDTISSDAGTSIGVTLGTDSGDDFNVGSGKFVVEGDTGNVGIGTATPTSSSGNTLEIYDAAAPTLKLNDGGDYKAYLKLAGNDLEIRGSNGQMEFYTGNTDGESSTERMKIASAGDVTVSTGNLVIGTAGQGITFSSTNTPAQSSGTGSHNTLDDYEEGEWTVTASMSTSGSVSLTTYINGGYTKIGRTVHIHGFIKIGSVSSPVGALKFSLPFVCVSGLSGIASRSVISIGTSSVDFAGGTAPFAFAEEGQSNMFVKVSGDNAGSSEITPTGNSYYYFGGSYSSA